MAITAETLRMSADLRAAILSTSDTEVRQVVATWNRAWNQLGPQFRAAVNELIEAGGGRWPSRKVIMSNPTLRSALSTATNIVTQIGKSATTSLTNAMEGVGVETANMQSRLIVSQLPQSYFPNTFAAVSRFNTVSRDDLFALIDQLSGQVTKDWATIPETTQQAIVQSLTKSQLIGESPMSAAQGIVDNVGRRFNLGLNRALTISRTQMLDAARSSARAVHQANSDVLAGWEWVAALDGRTCASCWAQHGNIYPVEVSGPDDHPQGRCARMPTVRPWSELGFTGVVEPPSILPDARQVFDTLPIETQLQIMGPQRLELLQSGSIQWSDLTTKRINPQWRDSWQVTPLSALAAKGGKELVYNR